MYSLSEEKDSESACVLLGKLAAHLPTGTCSRPQGTNTDPEALGKRAPSLGTLKKSKGVKH